MLEALVLVLQGDLLKAGNVRDLINRQEHYLRAEVELEESGVRMIAAAAHSRDGERRLTAEVPPSTTSPAGANRSRCVPSCPTTCA